MRHVVMFSGGIASWAAARRTVEQHGTDSTTLLFADTLIEDEDLYRFLDEAAADVGAELVRIADGRTPWQVFEDVSFLGNAKADPCSRVLKRELMRSWLDEHHDPTDTTVVLGFDWTERHRLDRALGYWAPWTVDAPLCEPPLLMREETIHDLRARGIEPPRLYALGFPHNNCGGFCIKAGHGQFAKLLAAMPERYAAHEAREEAFRAAHGDVAILVDRVGGGPRRPLTLRALRERIEAGRDVDLFDLGGCGCMDPGDEALA